MRHSGVLCGVLLISTLISGCGKSTDTDDEALATFEPRSPEADILGNVSPEGECDPEVIDIDHEKNTAQITYKGQPGDRLNIGYMDGSAEIETRDVELSSQETSVDILSSIYNGDIDRIEVEADGRVGEPGQCHIPVA